MSNANSVDPDQRVPLRDLLSGSALDVKDIFFIYPKKKRVILHILSECFTKSGVKYYKGGVKYYKGLIELKVSVSGVIIELNIP